MLLAILALLVCAAPASAAEQLLTLYSPAIESLPYVHRSEFVTLKPDGIQAPAQPGSILGFQEMALVDSKRPDAKPLPVDKMMVHHFLYYANGRVDPGPGGCLGDGFIGGRGEEHPSGRFDSAWPPELRARYGIRNATPEGGAPEWSLMTMVMNHYKRPKRFYVRTKVWYTTEPRQQMYPLTIGNCAHLANGMSYDVPGGGAPGSTYVDRSQWTVPFSGRILGGGSAPPRRRAAPDAAQRLLRPHAVRRQGLLRRGRPSVQHDPPDPARAGTDRERDVPHAAGHPGHGRGGARARGRALQRGAARGGDGLLGDCTSSATTASRRAGRCRPTCARSPCPRSYDRTRALRLRPARAAAAARRAGTWRAFDGKPIPVGDQWFKPQRLTAKVGEKITWQFRGFEPHSVTVANGPRGFSSNYLGVTRGSLLLHAHRARHVQAHVPHPPDDDESDGQRQTVLKKFRPRPSSHSWALMLRFVSSPVKSITPIVIRITPEIAVMIR